MVITESVVEGAGAHQSFLGACVELSFVNSGRRVLDGCCGIPECVAIERLRAVFRRQRELSAPYLFVYSE